MTTVGATRVGACFLVGAVVGTLLDAIHAYGGVLSYPDPVLGREAAFVPLEFGLIGAGVALALPLLERAARRPPPAWSATERIGELLLFACLYAATAIVEPGGAPWLALGLLALAGVRLAMRPVSGDWLYVLLAAVLGPLGEVSLLAAGVFDYEDPDVAGIPYWLPGLWANGGFLVRRLIQPLVVSSAPEPSPA